jgi:hypothetical protein
MTAMMESNFENLPPEIKEVQNQIELKDYLSAVGQLGILLNQSLNEQNKDLLSMVLDLLNGICDKSDETIELTLENVKNLLDHPDDWVRLEILIIFKKMYLVAPERFKLLIEKIESKLYDSDKKVRELAITIIAQVLKLHFDDYPELYLSFCHMFEDESWIVRARAVECSLDLLKRPIAPEMIEIFQNAFLKLIEDPDEEVRGFTTEAFLLLFNQITPEKYLESIDFLLDNSNWEIREKAIWLIGELGKKYFDELVPVFNKLVPMFADDVMVIQTKVIDAFVKMGQTQSLKVFDFFVPYLVNADEDIRQGISDTIIYISLQNRRILIPKLIEQLLVPKDDVQKIIGSCLLKIYVESPDGIEEELFRMFQSIDPEDWRQRKRTVQLLGNLCYVLRIKTISAWTVITLKNWMASEKDADVLDEINDALEKIYNVFDSLDIDIDDIEQKRKFFYEEMELLQKLPQELRNQMEESITLKKFTDAEIALEDQGNLAVEKINNFEKSLNESEFKRFSVEMIEDWNDIKEELLEELSDVKSFEYNRIHEGRSEFILELEQILATFNARIEVLKSEFENVKESKGQLQQSLLNQDVSYSQQFLTDISTLREKVYNIEFDFGQVWIRNIEFKDVLKDVTINWINTKIEIQQFLANVIQDFNIVREMAPEEGTPSGNLRQKITFEFLNQEFQNAVMQAIQNQREILEKFSSYTRPINEELGKRKFNEARNLLEMTLNNFHTAIETSNRDIYRVYEQIDKIDIPIKDANEIRRYLNHWNEVKDLLLNKIQNFKEVTEDQILIDEIMEFQRYINPIPLAHVARILNLDFESLKERVIGFVKDHQIHAIIRDDQLIQLERPTEENFLAFYRKVEILGSKLNIAIRIYNPTKYFLNDISLTFAYPNILKLEEGSDVTNLNIREFEPEGDRVLHWVFKISKPKGTEKRYDLHKLFLKATYRNPFNDISTLEKEMELII